MTEQAMYKKATQVLSYRVKHGGAHAVSVSRQAATLANANILRWESLTLVHSSSDTAATLGLISD